MWPASLRVAAKASERLPWKHLRFWIGFWWFLAMPPTTLPHCFYIFWWFQVLFMLVVIFMWMVLLDSKTAMQNRLVVQSTWMEISGSQVCTRIRRSCVIVFHTSSAIVPGCSSCLIGCCIFLYTCSFCRSILPLLSNSPCMCVWSIQSMDLYIKPCSGRQVVPCNSTTAQLRMVELFLSMVDFSSQVRAADSVDDRVCSMGQSLQGLCEAFFFAQLKHVEPPRKWRELFNVISPQDEGKLSTHLINFHPIIEMYPSSNCSVQVEAYPLELAQQGNGAEQFTLRGTLSIQATARVHFFADNKIGNSMSLSLVFQLQDVCFDHVWSVCSFVIAINIYQNGGSINGGSPKWFVYNGKSH